MPHPEGGLGKERRLKKSRDIIRVFKRGERRETPFFSLLLRRNSLGYDRMAVVVNKKFGKAVERNRIRRRLKEIFRLYRKDVGYDMVFYVKKEAKGASFEELKRAFLSSVEDR